MRSRPRATTDNSPFANLTNAIHTGVLRDIVKDRAALREHWIPLSALLRRLQLDQPLEELRSRVVDLRAALQQGDEEQAELELEFVEGILHKMLDG
jgi:hypothetical protein